MDIIPLWLSIGINNLKQQARIVYNYLKIFKSLFKNVLLKCNTFFVKSKWNIVNFFFEMALKFNDNQKPKHLILQFVAVSILKVHIKL